MASNEENKGNLPPPVAQTSSTVDHTPSTPIPTEQVQTQTDALPTSTPVEMSDLQHRGPAQPSTAVHEQPNESATSANIEPSQQKDSTNTAPSPQISAEPTAPQEDRSGEAREAKLPPPAQPADASISSSGAPPKESAIGPAAETGMPSNVTDGSAVPITLLLTNGARHPFTITVKYLQRRNVAGAHADDFDPFSITVWAMKDLIWQDWRSDWEPRPTAPNSIRLIHFGKLLDDTMRLRECKFISTASNVVHMTIKPQELVDEEEPTKKSTRRDDVDEEAGGGCRCCVIL